MLPVKNKNKILINKKLVIFTFFLSVLFLLNATYAGGIGAGPGEVRFEKVLRGGYAEKTIIVTNGYDVPVEITITLEGPFKDWIAFEFGKNFTIPVNSTFEFKAIIKPPEDIPIGIYNGSITLHSNPQTNESVATQFATTTRTGVKLLSFLEITGEQLLEYEVSSISINDAEVGYPIEFFISGNNKGNVRVSPQVHIDILDRDKTKILKSADFDCSEVLPTTTGTDKFNISSENLTEGQYWANVSVSIGGKVLKQKLLTFDILAKGALKKKGELIRIANKVWVNTGEVVKIDCVFKNTGELTTTAKFKGEIHLDDRIVGVLESDELDVPVGETVNLTTYFTPKEQGRYIVKGNVYYSKKITFPKESIINVQPIEAKPVFINIQDNLLYILIAIIIALLIVLLKYK